MTGIETATIAVGTSNGVARIAGAGSGMRVDHSLEGHDVRCVAADPADCELAFAGTWDHGLFRSQDGCRAWEPAGRELRERRVISLAVSRSAGRGPVVYAGTEPANLYRSDDRGVSWRRLDGLHQLSSAPAWFYPPRAGGQRVRSIAPHATDPDTVMVGIEVGGVMRSHDGGETWEDHKRHCFADSHALATHPAAPERVYLGAAGGVAISLDGGGSWSQADRGIGRRFVWALAVDPVDPDLWYVSAAPTPMHAHRGDRVGRCSDIQTARRRALGGAAGERRPAADAVRAADAAPAAARTRRRVRRRPSRAERRRRRVVARYWRAGGAGPSARRARALRARES